MWQFQLVIAAMACVGLLSVAFFGGGVAQHYDPSATTWLWDVVAVIAVFILGWALFEIFTLRFYKKRMPPEYHPKKNA